jgi:hypothetical protein
MPHVTAGPPQQDQAVTWTAIAMAESGGNTEGNTNIPLVFIRIEHDQPQAPPSEDSRGLWQIDLPPPTPDGHHVAISIGDDRTIEVLGSAPPVFDFLL